MGLFFGSEAVNFFVIPLVICLMGYRMNPKMDTWILLRDLLAYIGGVVLFIQFNNLSTDWYTGIVLLAYGFLYMFIQYINNELKELVAVSLRF